MDQAQSKTMIFCTCTEYKKDFYLHRASNWFHNLKAIEKLQKLNPDFYIFNDGTITYEDIQKADSSLLEEDHLYIKNHDPMLGRLSDLVFPGWVRSFKHALEIGLEKYDYVIHIESDVLLLHPDKIVEYFDKPGMFCSHWNGRDICDSTLLVMNDKAELKKIYDKILKLNEATGVLIEGLITPEINWQFVFNGGRLEDDAQNLKMDLDFISQLYTSKAVNPESLAFKNAHDLFIFVATPNNLEKKMTPSNRYIPIQCTAQGSGKVENILHDDDDPTDNIVGKSNLYGQLTALYFLWKHFKPLSEDTGVGFFTHNLWLSNTAIVLPNCAAAGNKREYVYTNIYAWDEKNNLEDINGPMYQFNVYDLFTTKRQYLVKASGCGSSLMSHMMHEYDSDFYRTLENIIHANHFDYGHKIWKDFAMDELIPFITHLCFVTTYKHFRAYCELLFSICSELEEAYKDNMDKLLGCYQPVDIGKPAIFEKLACYILHLYAYKNKLVVKDEISYYITKEPGLYVQPYSSNDD